ncbi:MAG: SpoIIE family protein phosphatase [Candidatus Thiodiazotropha sp.]
MPNKLSTEQTHGKALIVEDEITNRLILKKLLQKHGYEVIEAENGKQSVALFVSHQPDIVFMDVMMPEMDGYEATEQIKQQAGNSFVPIIFLTAMSDEKALARCVEVGGDDFLSKPYSFTVLSAKVKAMERSLASALGALPTSEAFRSMTAKGFGPHQILQAINNKLYSLLPTGMFMAVQFVKIDHQLDHVKMINCGMPDCYLIDKHERTIKQKINSQSLPLGITPDIDLKEEFHFLRINEGERIILATDGVTEARNSNGELFGQTRYMETIRQSIEHDYILDKLSEELQAFCSDAPQDDDISVVEIPLIHQMFPALGSSTVLHRKVEGEFPETIMKEHLDCIEFQFTLYGSQLRQADPIPILINSIQETAGLHDHRRALFTILTELYINALDHGVLNLDSSLKQGENGFTDYFQQREQRLNNLTQGCVRINLRIYCQENGGYIIITIEDSGKGFDYNQHKNKAPNDQLYSGRGLLLVESLCKQFYFFEPGNKAEAIYAWEQTK